MLAIRLVLAVKIEVNWLMLALKVSLCYQIPNSFSPYLEYFYIPSGDYNLLTAVTDSKILQTFFYFNE